MQNKISLTSVLLSLTTVLAIGCSVAKFDAVEHVSGDGSNKVTQSDEDAIGADLIDTKDSQTLTTLECNGISVKDYPKAHQKVSINPEDASQPSELVLRFDNPRVINFLDHQFNYRRNLRFLSWAATQRVTIDINMDPASWSKTSPTDPELDCLLTKEIRSIGNPESVVVRMEKFEDQRVASEKLKSYFATEPDGYTLICQKNHRTQDREALSPMTLAKINKLLCGVGTVYKK
jgi:hypothetical protein